MEPQVVSSGVRTWQWVVTAIVIVVLIVIGIMVFGNKGTEPATTPTDTMTDTKGTGVNSIVVSDQYPGNVVYISSVQLEKGGWVVIHKDNKGTPGAHIGQVYVPAGLNPAKVTVSTPIVDGGTYYAMLHSDNGDQKFDEKTDVALTDKAGNIIMRVFQGSATAGANIKG